jgi:aryl carrier-like protein
MNLGEIRSYLQAMVFGVRLMRLTTTWQSKEGRGIRYHILANRPGLLLDSYY